MTRTTRQSVDKLKSEEMPPPPLPAPKEPAKETTTPQPPVDENNDPAITVHKRIRSPLFEKVFEKALKTSLSGITLENWNKCFPTPVAKRSEQMKEVRKKFCEIYELNVRKNFDEIIASRKLLASLDNLDILISEAQTRKTQFLEANPESAQAADPAKQESPESNPTATAHPQPPPPLSEFTPSDLYMSHLYPLLQIQSNRLESLRSQQQASIDKLIKRREDQQKEIQELIATLERRLAVVDEAAEGVKEICEMEMDDEDMDGM
ncbi:hypothetical protein ABW19_dt0205753 [Dactylella cylindrospora]|nr:hypothetical protein ABW19_dt0205753 [Dactylella cylindrospora]